jgi:hypothetical protein
MNRHCRITLIPQALKERMDTPCGEPAGPNGLCAQHEADRIRLGGAS